MNKHERQHESAGGGGACRHGYRRMTHANTTQAETKGSEMSRMEAGNG
jgi:hypothetical protein